MPFDSAPTPQTEAELLADFKAWVLRQPEDAAWDFYSRENCALGAYAKSIAGGERVEPDMHGAYFIGGAPVIRPWSLMFRAAALAAHGGTITRATLLRELAKLEGG